MGEGLDILNFIRNNLGDEGIRPDDSGRYDDLIKVDFVGVQVSGQPIIVDISRNVDTSSLARLNLMKDVVKRNDKGPEPRFLMLGKTCSNRIREWADQLGIEVILIDRSADLPGIPKGDVTSSVKVTSVKSWDVICALLRMRTTSIRQLSLSSGVSYGWAHATIKHLLGQGMVGKKGDWVHFTDVDKLLNGVSWERPVRKFMREEIVLTYDNKEEAADAVQDVLSDRNVDFTFCLFVAGSRYTNYSFRNDAVQLYLDDKDMDLVRGLASGREEGIVLQIFRPDRKVYDRSGTVEGLRITSPCQTLLDLAGLGYGGKDMTDEMVKWIATIR